MTTDEDAAAAAAKDKLTKKEQETLEKLLGDNQVQTAIQVIKGIKVYREYTEGPKSAQVVAEAEALVTDQATPAEKSK